MKAQDFLNYCRANGQYSFTVQDVQIALELPKTQTLNALHRLKQNKLIVSPAKGFYLILPPEYQAYGCLPADMFIPDLMRHLNQPYYVGFLSAAQFYGAAHQKPQQFQVVTLKNRRPLRCGRIQVVFIADKNVALAPTKKMNTAAGTFLIATSEVIAHDLVNSPQLGAGINNVATVLSELAENIDINELMNLTRIYPELFWLQRLGYLFEALGFDQFTNTLKKILADKKLHWAKLVPNAPYKSLKRDKNWKVVVNTEVEPDL